MQKRAQVTMFVILGIVIVIAIVIGFAFRKSISEKVSEFEVLKSEQAKDLENEITSYASSCLKKTTIEGLQYIFANGGYYRNAPKSISYRSYAVPYYMYEGKETVPRLEDVAVNLAKYIDGNINTCISSYSADLVVGKATSEVSLGKTVNAEVSHSLSMTRGETSVTVKKFDAEVEADARKIYDDSVVFFNEVKNISDTSLLKQGLLALNQKYEFSMPNVGGEQDIVYILYMKKMIEESKDVEYSFAVKYKLINKDSPEYGYLSSLFAAPELPDGVNENVAEPEEEQSVPEGQEMSYLIDNSQEIFKEMEDSNKAEEVSE